jgi:hypothetical protein
LVLGERLDRRGPRGKHLVTLSAVGVNSEGGPRRG